MRTKTILAFIFVFFSWGLYRFLHLSFPIWLEETVIKGAIFSLPLIFLPPPRQPLFVALGITRRNFFKSVYFGISFGMVLGLAGQLGNFLRHQGFVFSQFGLTTGNIGAFLILSLITAFWEQLLFSGYFLSQLHEYINSETHLVFLVGFGFSLLHLPALMSNTATASQIYLNFLLLFSLGISCAILRLRFNNLIAPIMVHALWGVTIFLFR